MIIVTHIPQKVRDIYNLYRVYTELFDDTAPVTQIRKTDTIHTTRTNTQHHANLLIVNNEHKTIYRFEPHGGKPTYYSYFTNFEEIINKLLISSYNYTIPARESEPKEIVGYTIFHPMRTCPVIGQQRRFDLYDGACFFHTLYFECLLIMNPDVLIHKPGDIDFKYIHRYLSDNYITKFTNFYFTLYYLISIIYHPDYYSEKIYEIIPLNKRFIDIHIINSLLDFTRMGYRYFTFYPFHDTLVDNMIELIKSDTINHEHEPIYNFVLFKLVELNRHADKDDLIAFIESIKYPISTFNPFTFLNKSRRIICSDNTYNNIIIPTIVQLHDTSIPKPEKIMCEISNIDPHTIIRLHRDNLLEKFQESYEFSIHNLLGSYNFALLCDYDFFMKYKDYIFYNNSLKNKYYALAIKYNENPTKGKIINLDDCIVQETSEVQTKITEMGFVREKNLDGSVSQHRQSFGDGDEDEDKSIELADVYNSYMNYKESCYSIWNNFTDQHNYHMNAFSLNEIKMFYYNIVPECVVEYVKIVSTGKYTYNDYPLSTDCITQYNNLFIYIATNLVIIDEIVKQLLFNCFDIVCTWYKTNFIYITNLVNAIKQFIESSIVDIVEKKRMSMFLRDFNDNIAIYRSDIDTLLKSDIVMSLLETSVPAVGGHMHAYNKFIKYNTKIKFLEKKIDHAINNIPDHFKR